MLYGFLLLDGSHETWNEEGYQSISSQQDVIGVWLMMNRYTRLLILNCIQWSATSLDVFINPRRIVSISVHSHCKGYDGWIVA